MDEREVDILAFRFYGTRIAGARGDSASLMFCTGDGSATTERDRLVFILSRREGGGVVLRRVAPIDGNGEAEIALSHEDTKHLTPGLYYWSVRYVLDAQMDDQGNIVSGAWVDTLWRNCDFEVLEVNG